MFSVSSVVKSFLMATSVPIRPTSSPLQRHVEMFFEVSLFAMVVIAFVALAGTGKLDALSLLFVLAALGIRAYFFATGRKQQISVQGTTRLTYLYSLFYIIDFQFISRSFVDATVRLVLFLMVVKVFSVHRDRDRIYLAVISFMMVLSAAILTVDSFFLASFVLFLLLTVATFISMEMRRSFQDVETAQRNAASTGDDLPPDAATPASVGALSSGSTDAPRRMVRSLAITSTLLVVSIFAGASVIFFVLPRISTGFLRSLASRNNFVAGFSDRVRLGEIGRIQQSDMVVMHIQFTGSRQVSPDLKLRGVSLTRFDGTTWSKDPREGLLHVERSSIDGSLHLNMNGVSEEISGARENRLDESNQDPWVEYQVSLQPIGTNQFFLVPVPISLTSGYRDYIVDGAATVGLNDPTRQIRNYAAKSLLRQVPPEVRLSRTTDYPAAISATFLQLPELDPRIPRLAAEITRNSPGIYEKAAAIENYLQTKFGYTLEMTASANPKEAPLTYFLFTHKKGHCEYFASAMAVMLRTQGIPSRIVNGFRIGEFNDVTGSYIVRAKEAHSWVEAYIPGFGWATFDPTPADELPPNTLWNRLSLYADAMREFWSEWVINYDFSRQNALAETSVSKSRRTFDQARLWMRTKYEALLGYFRNLRLTAARDPGKFGWRALFIIAGLFLLVNLPRMVRFLRSVRLARKPATAPRAAASIWYLRMVQLLRRRGMEKLPSQTPQEFLRSLPATPPMPSIAREARDTRTAVDAASPPTPAPDSPLATLSPASPRTVNIKSAVAEFTEHYERARFGGSVESASKLPELYEEIEEAVKK